MSFFVLNPPLADAFSPPKCYYKIYGTIWRTKTSSHPPRQVRRPFQPRPENVGQYDPYHPGTKPPRFAGDNSLNVDLNRDTRPANFDAGGAAKKYLQGEVWHDDISRSNNDALRGVGRYDRNRGNDDDKGEPETLEGFGIVESKKGQSTKLAEGMLVAQEESSLDIASRAKEVGIDPSRYLDGDGKSKQQLSEDKSDLSSLVFKEEDRVAKNHEEHSYEQLDAVELKGLSGVVNVEFNQNYIMDPEVHRVFEKIGVGRISEIWAEAKTVNLSKRDGEIMISISTGDKGFIFMSLDDFFRMATIPQKDRDPVRLNTPDITTGDRASLRGFNILLEKIRVNGKQLGQDRPHREGSFIPKVRYIGETKKKEF